MNAAATNNRCSTPLCEKPKGHLGLCGKMPSVPILTPRVRHGLDQLGEVLDEIDIAICWADKPYNNGEEPIVFGRNLRRMREILHSAIQNVTPAAPDAVPSVAQYAAETLAEMEATNREHKQRQLDELSVPMQSRPAFAHRAGGR
jgi:hypothetical protein